MMMQYRFEGGPGGRAAYNRFTKWAPSEGLDIKAGWVSATNAGGFLLLEVETAAALLEFSAKFKDLNEEINVTPVVELADGLRIALNEYQWVDSVS